MNEEEITLGESELAELLKQSYIKGANTVKALPDLNIEQEAFINAESVLNHFKRG